MVELAVCRVRAGKTREVEAYTGGRLHVLKKARGFIWVSREYRDRFLCLLESV